MNVRTYFSSSLLFASSILLWLAIIMAFLYLPRFAALLHTTKSLNIFTFPRVVDAQKLAEFERETGIKVYVNYYENNDELLVKMRQTGGGEYDLIFPSDFAVEQLINEGLLQRIDKSRSHVIKDIHPALLHKYYDPQNDYSIPYLWGLYGIGFDKKYFSSSTHDNSLARLTQTLSKGWASIFDESLIFYRIGMVNNASEAILLAALYLFGSIDNLDASKFERIKQLLIKQKKWVYAYTDMGTDYLLLSGSCPLVAGLINDVLAARKIDQDLDVIIPQEGTFMVIDNIAIPHKTTKTDMVYALIEFLYRPAILKHHVDLFAHYPPMMQGVLATEHEQAAFSLLTSLPRIEFFRNVIPEHTLQDIWLALKAVA